MIRVSILGNPRSINYDFAYPIRVFASQLQKVGIGARFFSSANPTGLAEGDILLVMEGEFRKLFPENARNRELELAFIEKYKSCVKKVIWFDNSDSSGRLRSYVMPSVDLYAKPQLLTDLARYNDESVTGILFRDYYVDLGVAAEKPGWKGPIPGDDFHKFRLAWNLGLSDWRFKGQHTIIRKIKLDYLWKVLDGSYNVCFTPPNLASRKISVSYHASDRSEFPTVAYHRTRTRQLLKELAEQSAYAVNYEGKLPRREYLQETENALIVPSPFGVGEICYRDFECFMAGAILLKPDMSHLKTWPEYYEPFVTYVPHRWDFSDFMEKITDILQNPNRYEDIARTGQRRFLESLSHDGGMKFAEHFAALIE